MATTELLKEQIDILAEKCCSVMSNSQREAFFRYQEKRIKEGKAYNARYSSIRVYYKGARAGKEREVYNIDGVVFTKLWSVLTPYVYSSATRSQKYSNVEDSLAEVKFLLFRVLRFFGPRPGGEKLSSYFKIIVNNVLTNISNKKTRQTNPSAEVIRYCKEHGGNYTPSSGRMFFPVCRKKLSFVLSDIYETLSLFETIGSESDNLTRIDHIPTLTYREITFNAEIPDYLRKPIELLIEGYNLTDVAEKCKVKRYKLKKELEDFFVPDSQNS